MSRPRLALPLWAWAAGMALFTGLVVTGGFTAGLGLAGRLTDAAVAWCFGLGSAAILIVTVIAGVAAHRTGAGLRALRDAALTQLRDPAVTLPDEDDTSVRGTAELADLSAALRALAVRMRMADELAVRQRTSAEQSSAGMFDLLSGLTVAEETARGQLSAELHDTVAQSLSLARASLDTGHVTAARDLLDEAEDQVRALMARTRPPGLRDGDLGSAVGGLRDDLDRRYGLQVRVLWPAEPTPLPLTVAIIVYRFFQEGLLNVVKHADVDAATVRLVVEGEEVVATVDDHGPGFDPAGVQSERGRHVGLGLLRERVRLAGGSLDVRSGPNLGTTLTMRMPLTSRVTRFTGRPQTATQEVPEPAPPVRAMR